MNVDDFSDLDVDAFFQGLEDEQPSSQQLAEEESIRNIDADDERKYKDLMSKKEMVFKTKDIEQIKKYANTVLTNLQNKNAGLMRLRDKNTKLTEENGALRERIRIAKGYIEKLTDRIKSLSRDKTTALQSIDHAERDGQIEALQSIIKVLEGRLDESRRMYPDRVSMEQKIQELEMERKNLQQRLDNLQETEKMMSKLTNMAKQAVQADKYRNDLTSISGYSRNLIHQIRRFQKYSDKVSKWVNNNMGEQYYIRLLESRDEERIMADLMHKVLQYVDILKKFIADLIEVSPDISDELILEVSDISDEPVRTANDYLYKRKTYDPEERKALTPLPKRIDFEIDQKMEDKINEYAPPETFIEKFQRARNQINDYLG